MGSHIINASNNIEILETLPKKRSGLSSRTPRQDVIPPASRDETSIHSHRENPEILQLTSPEQKAARIGLFVNIALAVLKTLGGWILSSEILIADGLHSATDIVADVVTLVTVFLSNKGSQTEKNRKIQSLGSICVGGFVLAGGFVIGLNGLRGFYQHFFTDLEHHNYPIPDRKDQHTFASTTPDVTAAWVAIASIIAKEWVYRVSKCFT
jgi:divalent metal cation (Fe/Co/Zn/Cd) transporter